jgi:hypothetical protein
MDPRAFRAISGRVGIFCVVWRRASYEALSVPLKDATLAQSVEQLIRNQQVVGSNPTGGSNKLPENQRLSLTSTRTLRYQLSGLSAFCPRLSMARSEEWFGHTTPSALLRKTTQMLLRVLVPGIIVPMLERFIATARSCCLPASEHPPHSRRCSGWASLKRIVGVAFRFRFQSKNRSLAGLPQA